jgi:glycosyltransferase involved in cell wall biosynthesis
MNPLISVIIPTYNHGQFIEEAVESVLAQTYKNFEVIVVDDGSTDNTREILKKYERGITYIFQNNKGVSSARNHGLSIAKGEVIAFLDSDDVWLPEKLSSQLKIMQGEHSIGLVGCGSYVMDYLGNVEREWVPKHYKSQEEFLQQLSIRNILHNPSCMLVKKECFNRAGFFNECLQFGEDWDMWLRIAKHYKVDFAERPLMKFRKHGFSKSYKRVKIIESNITKIIRDNLSQDQERIKRKAYSLMYIDLANLCLSENRKFSSTIYALRALWSYPVKISTDDNKFSLLIRSILPDILYRGMKNLKKSLSLG